MSRRHILFKSRHGEIVRILNYELSSCMEMHECKCLDMVECICYEMFYFGLVSVQSEVNWLVIFVVELRLYLIEVIH